MVKLVSDYPDGYTLDQIRQVVSDWVNNHAEWTEDPVEHTVSLQNTDPEDGETEYLSGDFRFQWDADVQALLDDAEAAIRDYVAWYRIAYYECDHDAENGPGCPWDTSKGREYNAGQIPAGVPVFA